MIGDVLADILGSTLFDILFGWALPNRSSKPIPEGNWNATLGALSAFLAVDALLLAVVAISLRDDQVRPGVVLGMLAFAVLLAYVAFRFGRRAPAVSKRNRSLAAVGIILSLVAALVSAVGLAATALQGGHS